MHTSPAKKTAVKIVSAFALSLATSVYSDELPSGFARYTVSDETPSGVASYTLTDEIDRTYEGLIPGQFQFEHGRLVNFQVEGAFQPTEGSFQPTEGSFQPFETGNALAPGSFSAGSVEEFARSLGISGNSEAVPAGTLQSTAPTDAASALQDSNEIQTVNIQRRSAISFDPRIRGYRLGQVLTYGEGAYFMPVRPDLDSMLSKIDPQLTDNISVIPGPYTTRLGPGFSFLDVNLTDTPRYQNGPEAHNRFGYDFRSNGSRQYARDAFYGGGADYGYIVNAGFRNGVDYLAGNGQKIPGSYNVNNITAQVGIDLGSYTKLETRYDFLDQTKTEYPGQLFQVDNLQTDNASFSLHDYDDPCADIRMRIDGWYNHTPLRGSVGSAGGGIFRIRDRIEAAFEINDPGASIFDFDGFVTASLETSGGRVELLRGDEDYGLLRAGVDVRHQRQQIDEEFRLARDNVAIPPPIFVNTNMPPSESFNPGIYAEVSMPLSGYWKSRLGARVDYVHTTAFVTDPTSNFDTDLSDPTPFTLRNDDTPYAFYLTNDVQLTDCWAGSLSFGQAQRPPTLIERYTDGAFISVLQSGFTRVIGDPTLNQERLWQIDGGLTADYGNARVRVGGYHSWILDYITFIGPSVIELSGARLVRYTSTPLATLTGFEFSADADLNSSWNAYIGSHYVQGQDETLGAPLPGIPPLDNRIGLRWHDPVDPDLMGVDFGVRIVATQDRVGVIRTGGGLAPLGQATVEAETPTFVVVNVRGYWNPRDNVNFVAGVENLFDNTYLEHLDLRLREQVNSTPEVGEPGTFNPAFAYAPGITPYIGMTVTY